MLAAAGAATTYPGVLPRPLFGTPDAAAFCSVDAKSQDDRSAAGHGYWIGRYHGYRLF
jgi:hypothetical protein